MIIVIFEGRDTAGKGGVISRITQRVSPRVFRHIALPAPTEREKSQLYIQRYMAHFPAAGEIVLFDRSWYNRAGVERVMGFCSEDEYERFMRLVPSFEKEIVDNGIILLKYFLDVSQDEQRRRFADRIDDPVKHWKLSPMDTESVRLWWDYTLAYQDMLRGTDTPVCPWYIVPSDDKRRARLNLIAHMLSKIPYKKVKVDAAAGAEGRTEAQAEPKRGCPQTTSCRHSIERPAVQSERGHADDRCDCARRWTDMLREAVMTLTARGNDRGPSDRGPDGCAGCPGCAPSSGTRPDGFGTIWWPDWCWRRCSSRSGSPTPWHPACRASAASTPRSSRLLVYAVFGPSRILVLGPDSALAAVILGVVLPLSGGDPQRAVALGGMMALVSGTV